MNISTQQYFALIVPACVVFLAGVLLACWRMQRRQSTARFLLWIAAGYLAPALALGAQSLMSNTQLSQWALVTAVLYLGGAWCLAEGMVRRCGGLHTNAWFGALTMTATLVGLYYFSRVHDDLWARVQWLSMGVGVMLFLAVRGLLHAPPASDRLEWVLRWSYAVFAGYSLLRPLFVWALIPEQDSMQLAHSGYWLLTLVCTLFFSLWFSLVLLACAVRDVFTTLKDERNRDPLTRLLNRRAFMEAVETVLSDRRCGPWAVVVGDIDHFKRINDRCGHACGDEVLQAFSDVLLQQVRAGDLVCRYGGEEFVLLLQRASLDEAQGVVQRIRRQLAATQMPCLLQDSTVTVSFGIAPVQGLLHLTTALSRADALLYEAKESGRDRVRVDAPLPQLSTAQQH